MPKRVNVFVVTESNKVKGVKDRRNILPLTEIQERILYDPREGTFVYRNDCALGKGGDDAVWGFRRTDNAGTPYKSTKYWEYVKFDENHWYEPMRLAYYYTTGEWPPARTWVAGSRKYDYSAAGLELMQSGRGLTPAEPPVLPKAAPAIHPQINPTVGAPKGKGFWARLFGMR